MARSSKMSVVKRQRERKKAEKAAQKREERALRKPAESSGTGQSDQLATEEDLAGYGLGQPVEDDDERD